MIEALKPCPFCGSELVHIAVKDVLDGHLNTELYAVGHCKMCDAEGKKIRLTEENKERAFQLAFEAWNIRGGKC